MADGEQWTQVISKANKRRLQEKIKLIEQEKQFVVRQNTNDIEHVKFLANTWESHATVLKINLEKIVDQLKQIVATTTTPTGDSIFKGKDLNDLSHQDLKQYRTLAYKYWKELDCIDKLIKSHKMFGYGIITIDRLLFATSFVRARMELMNEDQMKLSTSCKNLQQQVINNRSILSNICDSILYSFMQLLKPQDFVFGSENLVCIYDVIRVLFNHEQENYGHYYHSIDRYDNDDGYYENDYDIDFYYSKSDILSKTVLLKSKNATYSLVLYPLSHLRDIIKFVVMALYDIYNSVQDFYVV